MNTVLIHEALAHILTNQLLIQSLTCATESSKPLTQTDIEMYKKGTTETKRLVEALKA
jgi:hypothetical protein